MHNRKEFAKLLTASFISQTGSHFLTLAITAFVFASTGSVIKAALVFVFSYLPSVFVSASLGGWIDKHLSKGVLASNELISILCSGACGACLYFKPPMLCLITALSLRSILLFVSKSAGTKWLKIISPPPLQSSRIKIFFLSFFLSTGVAGTMASVVLAKGSMLGVVVLDIATYIGSFLIILFLENVENAQAHSKILVEKPDLNLLAGFSQLFENETVRVHFVIICLTQAIFQGAYSVLVSYLPIHHFRIGVSGLGWFQIAASIGIIFGFAINWRVPSLLREEKGSKHVRLGLLLAIGALSLLACTKSSLDLSLLAFFLFNCAYECVWLFHSAAFFENSPTALAATLQFTLTSVASFLMALATLTYSIGIEYAGLQSATYGILAFGLIVGGHLLIKRFQLVPAFFRGNR